MFRVMVKNGFDFLNNFVLFLGFMESSFCNALSEYLQCVTSMRPCFVGKVYLFLLKFLLWPKV